MSTKMQCWIQYSDSHGLVMWDPMWLPEGDYPELEANYERVPQLDFVRRDGEVQQLDLLKNRYRADAIETFENMYK